MTNLLIKTIRYRKCSLFKFSFIRGVFQLVIIECCEAGHLRLGKVL